MAASSHSKPMGLAGYLAFAVLAVLLIGAVSLRLIGDEGAAISTAASDNSHARGPCCAPHPGDVAPSFALQNLDGQAVSLSECRGRPTLINFWAPWCGPCKTEMPAIQAAYEAHQEDGLVVLAIAVDDSAQNVRRFVDEHDLTFQPLVDDGSVSQAYHVLGLPTSFFVGSDGKVSAVHTGPLTEEKIEAYLSGLN